MALSENNAVPDTTYTSASASTQGSSLSLRGASRRAAALKAQARSALTNKLTLYFLPPPDPKFEPLPQRLVTLEAIGFVLACVFMAVTLFAFVYTENCVPVVTYTKLDSGRDATSEYPGSETLDELESLLDDMRQSEYQCLIDLNGVIEDTLPAQLSGELDILVPVSTCLYGLNRTRALPGGFAFIPYPDKKFQSCKDPHFIGSSTLQESLQGRRRHPNIIRRPSVIDVDGTESQHGSIEPTAAPGPGPGPGAGPVTVTVAQRHGIAAAAAAAAANSKLNSQLEPDVDCQPQLQFFPVKFGYNVWTSALASARSTTTIRDIIQLTQAAFQNREAVENGMGVGVCTPENQPPDCYYEMVPPVTTYLLREQKSLQTEVTALKLSSRTRYTSKIAGSNGFVTAVDAYLYQRYETQYAHNHESFFVLSQVALCHSDVMTV
jgi:hypothetical protein